MHRSLPKLIGLLVVAISVVFPNLASASAYTFNGADVDGMIVWDGSVDASTSNSDCLHFACITSPLGPTAPNQIRALREIHGFASFPLFDVELVLSVANADLNLADCGPFGATVTCQSADDFIALFYPNCQFGGSCPVEHNPGNGPGAERSVVRLPMVVAGPEQFQLTGPGIDLLTNLHLLNGAQWANAFAGFRVRFREIQLSDDPSTPYDDFGFTPFTMSLVAPQANVVPEPATLALLGSGVATLVARRRRARR